MYPCDVCHKVFQTLYLLDVHYRCHTGERPYSCNTCQKGFRQKGHLTDHLKLHSNVCSYECTICGKGFRQSSGLRHHKTHFHEIEEVGELAMTTQRVGQPRKCKNETVENHEALEENIDGVDVQGLHKCDICLEVFSTATRLKNHIAWHKRRKRYKCLVCGHVFKYLKVFRKHQKVHEKSPEEQIEHDTKEQSDNNQQLDNNYTKESFCKSCEKPFSSIVALNRHIREHHKGLKRKKKDLPDISAIKKHRCHTCKKRFTNVNSLRVHRKRKHSSQVHRCSVCHRSYGVLNDLLRHYKTHGLMPYKCNVCGESFQYLSYLKGHNAVHEESGGSHQCGVCGKQFMYLSQLKKHLVIHEEHPTKPNSKRYYECDVCQKIFIFPSQLKLHHKIHENKNRHKCADCGQTFRNATQLSRHQASHVPEQHEPSSSGLSVKKPFRCNVCSKYFQHELQLRKHFVMHTMQPVNIASEEPYHQTSSTGAAYSKPISRQEPTGTAMHPGIQCGVQQPKYKPRKKAYCCSYCNKSFHQTSHLKRHCQTNHGTNKPFRCKGCSVAFAKKTERDGHLRTCPGLLLKKKVKKPVGKPRKNSTKVYTIQSGQVASFTGMCGTQTSAEYTEKSTPGEKKQYTLTRKKTAPTCNICGGQFSTAANLRMHMDIHYDRRPFPCRFCGKNFRQLGHLSSHCRRVHKENLPYQCELCSAAFKGPIAVKFHMKTDHGLTEDPNKLDGFKEPAMPRYSNIDYEPTKYMQVANSGQVAYACSFCDAAARTFRSLSGLRRHITVVHGTNKNQPAITSKTSEHCQIPLNRRADESPLMNGHSEEVYKCNVCSVIVHGVEALEAHEKAHTKTGVRCSNSSPPSSSGFVPPEPDVKQTFECKFCGEKFDGMSREAFDQHELDHELTAEEPMGMAYMCLECDKEFAIASELVKHHEETHS